MQLVQGFIDALSRGNPPGYLYAVAYSISAMLLSGTLPKRIKGKTFWAAQVGWCVVIGAFAVITDIHVSAMFIPTLMAVLGLVLLQVRTCTDTSLSICAYTFMRAFAAGELFASLEGYVFYAFIRFVPGTSSQLIGMLCAAALFILLVFAYRALGSFFAQWDPVSEIDWSTLIQTFAIVLAMYCLGNISNVYQNENVFSTRQQDVLLVRSLVDFGGLMMLGSFHLHLIKSRQQLENQMLHQLVETQYRSFKMDEQSVALVRQMHHDLKHQIAYLREGIQQGAGSDLLDEMEDDLGRFEDHQETGNDTLDILLTSKARQCKDLGMELRCFVDGNVLGFMGTRDLVSLFGNALDNSIEAVMRIPEDGDRTIEVHAGQRRGFIVIRVVNSFVGTVSFVDGRPKTTKDEPNLHGFGTRGIEDIAHKYGGVASFTAEGGQFELKVVIPTDGQS